MASVTAQKYRHRCWIAIAAAAVSIVAMMARRPVASVHEVISVTPPQIDVEAVSDAHVAATVTIRNISAREIRIGGVEASCSCTAAAPLATHVLRPGEETSITLRLTPPKTGIQQTRVSILLEDPHSRFDIPVRMQGRRVEAPAVVLQPPEIFGVAVTGEPFETSFEVQTLEHIGTEWLLGFDCELPDVIVGQPLLVHSVKADSTVLARHYKVSLTIHGADLNSRKLATTLTPRVASTPTRDVPAIRCVVDWKPALRAYPSAIVVDPGRHQVWPVVRRIVISGADGRGWDVQQVKCEPDWLKGEVVQSETEGAVRIIDAYVSAPDDMRGVDLHGTIEIRTGVERHPLISIPVTVMSRGG
ncbi:MAG: DUF1573 domain-containing protein [Planctomyces sp.]|nr:DUF1573 domain-containing protein [Planctomyces sp.]